MIMPVSAYANKRVLVLTIFVMISASCYCSCQEGTIVSIDNIKEAYAQFRFTEVITLATQALTSDPSPSGEERVQIYTYLAYTYIALGENDKGKESFEKALAVDSSLTLDPTFVSPKIIAIFNEVKTAYDTREEEAAQEPVLFPTPPLGAQKRFGGAWRSLLLPGWGQLYKGHKKKAIAIFAVQTVNVGTTVYAHFKMKQAHDDYQQARDPETIESSYDRYNSYYKTRNYFFILTAAVWIYAHIDAAVSQPSFDVSVEEKGVLWIPIIKPTSCFLTCSIRF